MDSSLWVPHIHAASGLTVVLEPVNGWKTDDIARLRNVQADDPVRR
jgi:hypothetical protein